MFQRLRPDTSDIRPSTTPVERLEAYIRDITATWTAIKSLTNQDSRMLMRFLVAYLAHYGRTTLAEPVLHNITVHAFAQLFALCNTDGEGTDEQYENGLTLWVEPTQGVLFLKFL